MTPVVRAMKLNDYPEPEIRPLGPDDAPSILLDPSRTFARFRRDRPSPRSTRSSPHCGRLLAGTRRAGRLHAPDARAHEQLMRILITGGAGCLGSNLIEH